jgi:hypothetical protein
LQLPDSKNRFLPGSTKQAQCFVEAKSRLMFRNARMSRSEIRKHCAIDKAQAELL